MKRSFKGREIIVMEPVICSYDDGPYWNKFKNLTTKAYSIPLRKLSLSSWLKLRSILNKEKPDLIHTHGKGPGLYGRIAGWLFRIPVIHSFHGFHYYDQMTGSHSFLSSLSLALRISEFLRSSFI